MTVPADVAKMLNDPAAMMKLTQFMTAEELEQFTNLQGSLLAAHAPVWAPQQGPQTTAYNTEADITFYGGAGGGGKTDILLGLAVTKHRRSIIFRKQATELPSIIDRLVEILGSKDGFNGSTNVWKVPARIVPDCQIEFGSCPNPGDYEKHRGRPHDLKAFDEITAFDEFEFRFICGWLRSSKKGQRCRVVVAGNPPSHSVQGQWVVKFWGPWLDPGHPNPAKPGELRFFAMIVGVECERPNGKPIVYKGETIIPKSRTFIPAKVQNNLFLPEYEQQLQSLPEPLRSQMLYGLFNVGKDDDQWQIFPTSWVDAAQKRWTEDGHGGKPMDSMGVDVARGGKDESTIARRHGNWYAPILSFPGAATPDGPAVAALVIQHMRNAAVIHIDIIGTGGSAYDFLSNNLIQIVAVDARTKGNGTDKSGLLRFKNKRAEICWRFREMLDPENEHNIALPPGADLRAELCAFRWKITGSKDGSVIQVCEKDDIKAILNRSPDNAEAIIYSSIQTDKKARPTGGGWDTRGNGGGSAMCA